MVGQLLELVLDLLLNLSLLVIERLNDARDDVGNLLSLEAAQLRQLLHNVQVEVGKHRVQSCLRLLPLFKQLLLERVNIEQVFFIYLCHALQRVAASP